MIKVAVKATSRAGTDAVLLTCAEFGQPRIGGFVEDPNLRQLVLLLQQKPDQVLPQEARTSGDEVDETRVVVRHAAVRSGSKRLSRKRCRREGRERTTTDSLQQQQRRAPALIRAWGARHTHVTPQKKPDPNPN